MMKIIRHAFVLIREDKLFSAIYIAGTAVAIASAMVIAIVLNIKLGNISPESNRSRTLYFGSTFVTQKEAEKGGPFYGQGVSVEALDSCFRQLKSVELATGIYTTGFTVGDEKLETVTNVATTFCDPDFFRLYNLTFTEGRPFSEKEFRSGESVCVVSDKLARKLGNATHVVLLYESGKPSLRIVGVIKAVSSLMSNAAADIYIPYTTEGLVPVSSDYIEKRISYAGYLDVRILLREGYSRQNFLDELEPLRKHYNAVVGSQLGEWVDWVVSANTHFFKNLHFFGDLDDQSMANQAMNLMPPALLMLLFLFLPAINLSGLVTNRMEARRAEMAIRKTFGAKRRTLFNEIIHENLVLTLCGGIVGWGLSGLFVKAVCHTEAFMELFRGNAQMNYDPSLDIQMFFTPTLFLVAFVCCAVLNLMAALVPAWRSLRKPIVESLNQKR